MSRSAAIRTGCTVHSRPSWPGLWMTAGSLSGVSDSGWALRWLPRAMSRPFIHRISFFTSFSMFQRLTAFPCGFISRTCCNHLWLCPVLSESVLGGVSLTSLAFTLCGFQAIHSSHEPFYLLMPYLPLALMIAERFMSSGRIFWLPLLALSLGLQWTLGHFQLQTWTGGFVVLATGVWRAAFDHKSWRRAVGLLVATGWGVAIAAVQLGLSWELAQFVAQTNRKRSELLYYSFPPAHWFELVLPRPLRELRLGAEDPYWDGQQTTGFEAALYVGTLPLIFAVIGAVGKPRSRASRSGGSSCRSASHSRRCLAGGPKVISTCWPCREWVISEYLPGTPC